MLIADVRGSPVELIISRRHILPGRVLSKNSLTERLRSGTSTLMETRQVTPGVCTEANLKRNLCNLGMTYAIYIQS